MTIDGAWLRDPQRVFPVYVDPPLVWGNVTTDDTYVQSGYPGEHSTDTELKVGTYTVSTRLARF